jgi:hypothetical protein
MTRLLGTAGFSGASATLEAAAVEATTAAVDATTAAVDDTTVAVEAAGAGCAPVPWPHAPHKAAAKSRPAIIKTTS